FAGIQQRAFRTVRVWRTGRVRVMRLLPLARLVVFPGRRGIHAVMDPAMPARRDRGRFRIAVVGDPAAGAALRILAALVVDVADLIGADAGAVTPGMEAGSERLAVPPGEELFQKGRHRFLRQGIAVAPLMASHGANYKGSEATGFQLATAFA